MTLVAGAEQIINIAGALLVVALGVFVASVRPRRAGNLPFATFCVAFGLSIGATNVLVPDQPVVQAIVWSTALVFALVQTGALIALARDVPSSPSRSQRGLVVAAFAVAVVYFGVWSVVTWIALDDLARGFLIQDGAKPVFLLGGLAQGAAIGVWMGYLALLALRVNSLVGMSEASYRTLAAGLLIFPGAFHGLYAGALEHSLLGWPFIGSSLMLAGVWLYQAGRGQWPRTCRNLALFALALPLGGMLYSLAGLPGGYGVARTLSVIVFGYAILSGQLLGIDVKLRWTISKSTVAAVFVAVFFVASEAAQQFFGESLGSAYVGIAAAGALVFAIAPLQRAAERLAEAAVPLTGAAAGAAASGEARGEASYRKAVRLAMRDRTITREEEGHLHELARDLGMDGARAHAIIVALENEAEMR